MSNLEVSHKILHNDDICLKLEYPENSIGNYTELTEEQIKQSFEVFSRMFFDDILTKDRKEFAIEFDEESNGYQYLVARKKEGA